MPIRLQPSFFDVRERTAKLKEMGDPLVGLNERIDWETFRPSLNAVYWKVRKSKAVKDPDRLHLIVAGGMGPITAVCHGWNDSSRAVHGTYEV